MYWYGAPNEATGLNLATCIWQSREHAIRVSSLPQHAKAMGLAAKSFEVYSLERYLLRKEEGQPGVTVEPYIGGEVI